MRSWWWDLKNRWVITKWVITNEKDFLAAARAGRMPFSGYWKAVAGLAWFALTALALAIVGVVIILS